MVGMACVRSEEPDVLPTQAPTQRMGTSEVLMPRDERAVQVSLIS